MRPFFTAIREDGASLVTFHEGPDRSGRVLAYWNAGQVWIAPGPFLLGRTDDMDQAGRMVSVFRKLIHVGFGSGA